MPPLALTATQLHDVDVYTVKAMTKLTEQMDLMSNQSARKRDAAAGTVFPSHRATSGRRLTSPLSLPSLSAPVSLPSPRCFGSSAAAARRACGYPQD